MRDSLNDSNQNENQTPKTPVRKLPRSVINALVYAFRHSISKPNIDDRNLKTRFQRSPSEITSALLDNAFERIEALERMPPGAASSSMRRRTDNVQEFSKIRRVA